MFLKRCHGECELFEGSIKKYYSTVLCSFTLLEKVSILSKGSHCAFFFLNRAWGQGEMNVRTISILRNLPKAQVCDYTDSFLVFRHVLHAHSQTRQGGSCARPAPRLSVGICKSFRTGT